MEKFSSRELCIRACIKEKKNLITQHEGKYYVFFNKKESVQNEKGELKKFYLKSNVQKLISISN